jgi:hypothetical protein
MTEVYFLVDPAASSPSGLQLFGCERRDAMEERFQKRYVCRSRHEVRAPWRVHGAHCLFVIFATYAEKDVPQPQPPVAFGFSKVKPEPIMFDV